MAQEHYSGVVMGTGALITVNKEKCGFKPRMVKLINKTGLCSAEWLDTMANDSMQKSADSGAGAVDNVDVTSNGIIPLASGFSIGTDADLNVSGEAIHYEAWG